MGGKLRPPRRFQNGSKTLVSFKGNMDRADAGLLAEWRGDALRTGTGRRYGDVEAIPALIPAMWHQTPLRVISFVNDCLKDNVETRR